MEQVMCVSPHRHHDVDATTCKKECFNNKGDWLNKAGVKMAPAFILFCCLISEGESWERGVRLIIFRFASLNDENRI